ncbi:unnamed protein product, partial [Rotaria sp. Silwood2]
MIQTTKVADAAAEGGSQVSARIRNDPE